MPARHHDDDDLNAVGDMIRRLREGADMTQQELALQVGTAPRTVQRWEQRNHGTKPDAVDLLKILSVFGIVVPQAPRFRTIAYELERIYDRLDALAPATDGDLGELVLALQRRTPIADALTDIVAELNRPTPPTARRQVQMRRVVEEFDEAARLGTRLAAALLARLEAADSGH